MAKQRYRITNYGATRRFPYKGQYYEIPRGGSIETEDEQLAKEFNEFQFVDAVAIEQPIGRTFKRKASKKKVSKKKSSKQKKKVTAEKSKKTKRRKR